MTTVIGRPTNFVHKSHIGFDPDKGFDVRARVRSLAGVNGANAGGLHSRGLEEAIQGRRCGLDCSVARVINALPL